MWGCWNGRVSDMVGGLRALRGVLLYVCACGVVLCASCTCVDDVQVAMMGVVSSAVAAMDAHRGVAAVAESGVLLLRNLSEVAANQVCARHWSRVDSGQEGWRMRAGGRSRVCAKAGGLRP